MLLGMAYGSDSDDSPVEDNKAVGTSGSSTAVSSGALSGIGSLANYAMEASDDSDSDEGGAQNLFGSMAGADGPIDIGAKEKEEPVEVKKRAPRDQSLIRSMDLLPPEPSGTADPQVQAKIKMMLQKTSSFNYALQDMKQFHNPSLLDRISKQYKIDEHGSNYLPEIYNPKGFDKQDFYDAISHAQEQARHTRPASSSSSSSSSSSNPVKKFKSSTGVARKLTTNMAVPTIAPPMVPGNARLQQGLAIAQQLSMATMNGLPLSAVNLSNNK